MQDPQLDIHPPARIAIIDHLASAIAVVYLVMHLVALTVYPVDPLLFRAWHVGGMALFAYVYWLAARPKAYDAALILVGIAATIAGTAYISLMADEIVMRAGVFPETEDVVVATIMLLVVLDITRRAAGLALVFLALFFILYGLYGSYFPQMMSHGGYSFARVVTYLYTTNGIYGIPVGSSATFIYFFVVFGALLSISGGADYMMKLALALTGRTRGGTAKVGVVASGLFGMINGTSAGNVVATGAITIPMMIRSGFRREFAGATEAVASSGGQILPPVMGAAAFLMIEMTGIPYSNIIISAAMPAILYFFAVYLMVHFEAVRMDLRGATGVEIPSRRQLMLHSYYLIPLTVLLASLLVLEVSIIRAALYSVISVLIISMFNPARRIGPKRIVAASREGGEGIISIATTCATAGVVIGILNLTGLGIKVATLILTITGGILWLTLIVTMIVTIILGMGMPTVAAYAITGAVVAPALIKLGVEPMGAHLFILFFASMSAITPPVALASFAAAAIANANLVRLSILAMKLGLAGFLIPYLFVYRPGLLFIGTTTDITVTIVEATIAVAAAAAALRYKMANPIIRGLWALGAFGLVFDSWMASSLGLALIAITTGWQYYDERSASGGPAKDSAEAAPQPASKN
ncbi:MAG: TRAP transporter permease [Hyphomicrobiales bacterium]